MRPFLVSLLAIFCAMGNVAYAQEHPTSLTSTVPSYARYEIVQSPLLAKLTIRLDRFSGETWQFVETTDGSFVWQRLVRESLKNDIAIDGKVNYQIFLSGLRAQVTLLMNTNTGATWYMAEDPKVGEFWARMK